MYTSRFVGRLFPAALFLTVAFTIALSAAFPPRAAAQETEALPETENSQEINFATLLISLLDGYQNLITTDAINDAIDAPGVAWETVAEAVRQGFLRFTIDPMNESIVDGARFYASPDENVARIYLSPPLIEIARDRPGTAYGILMRAVAEAAVFFETPESWWAAQTIELDRLFLIREGYRLQAEMTKNRLVPRETAPGSLGNFILQSFENDNLVGVMLYLESLSLPTAVSLNELREVFRKNGDTEALRRALLSLGEELLDAREALPADTADGLIFPAAVSVHTWLELTPGLLTEIYRTEEDERSVDFGNILEEESEYAALRRKLETSRISDMPLIFHISENTRMGFETR